MKSLIVLSIALLATPAIGIGQTTSSTEKALEARIIALDKQGWEAWKNNDPAWFRDNTIDGFISISSDGISKKAEVVKATATDCMVKAYSLANHQFSMLDENAILLTYTATQDAVCGGKKAPPTLQVAVNYVKRRGKWLEAMYMQAP
jgi:hypothetical protein